MFSVLENFVTVTLLLTLLSFNSCSETEGKSRKRPPKASRPPPPPPPPPGLGDFDYYVLVLQWTTSYCSATGANGRNVNYCENTDYRTFPKEFTIHGLWPTDIGGRRIVKTNEAFNIKELGTIVSQLNVEWPNARYIEKQRQAAVNNSQFWQHEWDKHGTSTTLSQLGYFKLTLGFHQKVKRFMPRYNGSDNVNITNLKQGFQALGGLPEVECNFDKKREQIFELRFNITRSHNFVNHQSFGNGCSLIVYLP